MLDNSSFQDKEYFVIILFYIEQERYRNNLVSVSQIQGHSFLNL
jgi:hypothetical protein